MLAPRGTTLVELDQQASEAEKPYGIITVDCSNPYEYDDGIAVTPLPLAEETYRVSVFAVDGSGLYRNDDIVKQALARTESRYDSSKKGSKAYTPMLDPEVVRQIEFSQGNVRDALVVSFLIGAHVVPSEVKIEFGRVEVTKNLAYNRFGNKCRYDENFVMYGRAAALIIDHLEIRDFDNDFGTWHNLIHVPSNKTWRRGATINEAYMVAANHLIGRTLRDEGIPAPFRRHDTQDDRMTDIFGPQMAYYSTTPGLHEGIGVDPYLRGTSPLRRLEDLVTAGILRARSSGKQLGTRDHRIIKSAVQRLNQRTAAELFNQNPRMQPEDLWVRQRRRLHAVAS